MKIILLIIAALSFSIRAEIDLVTLDNWNIVSTTEHDLFISKHGELNPVNFIGFRMGRASFCVCNSPIINLAITNELEEGSLVNGTMTVDMTSPKSTRFRVLQWFESGSVLLRPLSFPSLRKSRVVEIDSDIGKALFITNGIENAMSSSKNMCETNFYFEHVEPKAKEMDV
jgi:hypothetical protein